MWSPWCETVWPFLYESLTKDREPQVQVKKETFWSKILRFLKLKEVSA
jgi:hypothetical protein